MIPEAITWIQTLFITMLSHRSYTEELLATAEVFGEIILRGLSYLA